MQREKYYPPVSNSTAAALKNIHFKISHTVFSLIRWKTDGEVFPADNK